MKVYGIESVAFLLKQNGYVFKLLANERGVVFFPCSTEHRDASHSGIFYADDSQGNALAGMVKPGQIEFRFHRQFSDARVKQIAERMMAVDQLEFVAESTVTYRARTVVPAKCVFL